MTKADPLVYMATTDSAWAKGRITVMLPSGQVLQQFGDADDKTEAGKRLTNPHSVAVAPGCRSVVVPELSKRIARFTLTAPAPTQVAWNAFGLRDVQSKDAVLPEDDETDEDEDEDDEDEQERLLDLDILQHEKSMM